MRALFRLIVQSCLPFSKVPIADDGTIEFRDEERVDFAFQVRSKHIGALVWVSSSAATNSREHGSPDVA